MWLPSFNVWISSQYQPLGMSQKLWYLPPQYLFSLTSMARDCSEYFPASLQIDMTHVIKFGPIIQKWKDHTAAPGTLWETADACPLCSSLSLPPACCLEHQLRLLHLVLAELGRVTPPALMTDSVCKKIKLIFAILDHCRQNLVLTTTDFKATGS